MDILKRTLTQMSQYITVRTEDTHDGIIASVQEINLKGGPGAQIALFLDKRLLTAESRKTYMEIVIRNAVYSIGQLFEDCEKDECPQCHGNKVEHIA